MVQSLISEGARIRTQVSLIPTVVNVAEGWHRTINMPLLKITLSRGFCMGHRGMRLTPATPLANPCDVRNATCLDERLHTSKVSVEKRE